MDLKHIRAFLTVAETGNMTRAAETLRLVQPAISRQIKLLEEDIGTSLFRRERHGMVLTEAGRVLRDYAQRATLELDRARAEIGGNSTGISGLVTLGLLPSTIDVLASPLLEAVSVAYPGIRLRIAMGYAGTLSAWLASGEVDAALLYGADQLPDIQSRPLIEEALWVIGPPEAKFRRARPVSLSRLVGKPLILPSAPHGIRTLLNHACTLANANLSVCAETNSLSVQRSLVLGGHGLTILPPIAVADDLRSGQLTGAPLGKPSITRTIVLALPTHRSIGKHVQSVVDLLVACAKRSIESRAWMEGRWLGK